MASGVDFNFHLFTDPWDEMQAEIARVQPRATMYALRRTAAAVRAGARAAAPVYHGSDPRATAESGNLRKSIKSSRSIKNLGGGEFSMTVMPTGSKKQGTGVVRHGNSARRDGDTSKSSGEVRGVPLYRRKIEEKVGYMKAGIDLGEGEARTIFESAYAKAFAKYAP